MSAPVRPLESALLALIQSFHPEGFPGTTLLQPALFLVGEVLGRNFGFRRCYFGAYSFPAAQALRTLRSESFLTSQPRFRMIDQERLFLTDRGYQALDEAGEWTSRVLEIGAFLHKRERFRRLLWIPEATVIMKSISDLRRPDLLPEAMEASGMDFNPRLYRKAHSHVRGARLNLRRRRRYG